MLSELADANPTAAAPPSSGGFDLGTLRTAMGSGNRKVDQSDKSSVRNQIMRIHADNGGNPLETLSDVVALTFSIVAPQMGGSVGRTEVMDFVKQFMDSQAGAGEQ